MVTKKNSWASGKDELYSMKQRVVVAMSGGVDSSVAASLLVDQGYEVIGLTMQTWPDESGRSTGKQRGCCGVDAAMDAFSVANLLGIPHYVLNFQEVFRKQVIENFTQQYLQGKTPNPCVRCNEFVKFNALLEKAVSLGADLLATGHYAKTYYDKPRNRHVLAKGKDRKKDQSYVLYPLKQHELKMSIFPLGDWTKEEVRIYAKQKGLSTAEKKESYDICFVPDGNYAEFIKKQGIEDNPGPIVNSGGEIVGRHQGVYHYTVGQRKGLGVRSNSPVYVTQIHSDTNTLVVGEESNLFESRLEASEVNWVSLSPPVEPLEAFVKIRSHAVEASAAVVPMGEDKVCVTFHEPQKAITPGQSVVFYEGEKLLGGGTIVGAIPEGNAAMSHD